MKVEIKEIKKERQDGFYKVLYMDNSETAKYYNKNWYVIGISSSVHQKSIKVLDENPITFEETGSKPEPEPFSPIELSLTIESEEELQDLETYLFDSSRNVYPLWNTIKNILNKGNLCKS